MFKGHTCNLLNCDAGSRIGHNYSFYKTFGDYVTGHILYLLVFPFYFFLEFTQNVYLHMYNINLAQMRK